MKTVFTRIFLSYFIVILLITLGIFYFAIDIIRESEQNSLIKNLVNINYTIHPGINQLLIDKDDNKLDSLVKSIGKKIDYRISIIDINGRVLADSKGNPSKMENHSDRPEIIEAINNKIGKSVRYSYTVKKNMLYVAIPIKSANKIIGISRFSIFMTDVDKIINSLRNQLLLIIVIIIIISGTLAYIFSHSFSKPIKELVLASQKFAEGDLNTKVAISNNNELKDIAINFNLMTEKIKYLFEKHNMQKEELKRIIASMQEGLIVLDKDNKIVMHNKSFKKTVNVNDIQDKFYWEILRDISVQTLVERVRRKQTHKTTEIKLNNVYYLCSANYIQTKDEIVIMLFDISERKQLEEMKRDFIVNASHELRTPLTAIKGFIETMEDEAQGNQVKYLEILKRHTSRLISIVEDLLTISKLEDERIGIQLSEVKIDQLLKDITTIFDEQASQKGIKINTIIDENLNLMKVDAFKIEQLFINLIDNSIKYTQKGEINISVKEEEKCFIIQVDDTGIGIPENDLSRIFERFYTVDKSRARKNVGTGLGLSIVKHIIQLHSGQIEVTSKLGEGTKFNIRLPKQP